MMLGGLRRPRAWAPVAAIAVTALMLLPAMAPAATKRITGTCASGSCLWKPSKRSIPRGDKIVWRVPSDGVEHSVTAIQAKGSRRWTKDIDLHPGEKTSKLFRRAGTYRFKCEYHPSTMRGAIKVT
jgi:plastocyanin